MKIKIAGTILAIGIVVSGILWMSQWPQRFAIERSLGDTLGAYVFVSEVDVSPSLSIERLDIHPDSHSPMFARLKGLDVNYVLAPESNRYISHIHVDSLELMPDASNLDEPNFQFLLDYVSGLPATNDDTWTPTTLTIDSIELSGAWGQANAQIGGFSLHIDFIEEGDMDITVLASNMSGGLSGLYNDVELEAIPQANAAWNLLLEIRNGAYQGVLEHNVPASHSIDSSFSATFEPERTQFEAKETTVRLHSDALTPFINQILGETSIDYTAGELFADSISWSTLDGLVPRGVLEGSIHDFTVSNEAATYYQGDLEYNATIADNAAEQSSIRILFNEGLELDTHFHTQGELNMVSAEFSSWEKSAILSTFPNELTAGLQDTPFEHVHGEYDLTWDESAFDFGGYLQSESTKDIDPIQVDIQLEGEKEKLSETVGVITAHIAGGEIHAKAARDEHENYQAHVEFLEVPIRPLMFLVSGNQLPESMTGRLGGTMSVSQALDSSYTKLTPKLEVKELTVNETTLESVRLEGILNIDRSTQEAEIPTLTIDSLDDSLNLSMDGGKWQIDSGNFYGNIEYATDLEFVGGLAGSNELYGSLTGKGTLEIKDRVYSIPFTFESNDIGYGELALPYGSTLRGEGTAHLEEPLGKWILEEAQVSLGEGTQILISSAQMTDDGAEANAYYKSDLKLGADMGYYANAEGTLEGNIHSNLPSDGEFTLQWDTSGTITQLVLNDNAGTVSGLTFAGEGNYHEAIQGVGDFSIDTVTAAGAIATSSSAPFLIEDSLFKIRDAKAKLFNGVLSSTVEMSLLESGFPLKYRGRLANIDLARLTEEVKPPKTNLTGKADGVVNVEYNLNDGIQGFDLEATSETAFTINRSLVEEMMQMQNVLSGLAEKKAKKAIDKFLGKAEQRPFDTAHMNAYLLDDVIQGTTEMRSVKTKEYNGLNLNIQLNIDKSALVSSLKLLEESNFGNVSF